MTGEQLIEVGRGLARSCLYLTEQGDGKPSAVWGGPGLVPAPPGPYRHWLTVLGPALVEAGLAGLEGCLIHTPDDAVRFAEPQVSTKAGLSLIADWTGSSGVCISVYTDEEECSPGTVAVGPSTALPESATAGVPLFGRKSLSWPPLDAVFLFGPPAVQEWLAANGWGPEEPYNDNFPDRTPVEVYGRAWQRECPLFGNGVFAQLGGWHMPWPDGDWYALLERRLVAWT